jgi:hypothetical protein
MGQNLANCIANRDGDVAAQILEYFYGADIQIRGAASQPPAPTPKENDPAAQPDPSMSSTTDPSMTTPDDTCWSYTLQRWVIAAACVQSRADSTWYQCVPATGWVSGVDASSGTGPNGNCTEMDSL